MSDQEYKSHYSVMLPETIDYFEMASKNCEDHLCFADMTFGAGGHSTKIAQISPTRSTVFSVDQDPDAFKNGQSLIVEKALNNLDLNKMNYEEFPQWFASNHPDKKLNAVVMDLGVSSHHFDKFERGFSFRENALLDMRMEADNNEVPTAREILNELDEEEIANIIFKYGEERLSRRIAAGIVEFRKEKPLEYTKELENICFHAYPNNQRHKKTHPATRTFQALRIYVNRELEVLENTLEKLFDLLAPNGVLVVISFHSLEDRIAKHKFKEIFQCNKNTAKILTKRPVYPSEKELEENPRSRSAKMRVIQKLD